MKKVLKHLFMLAGSAIITHSASANAELQVIHNAADPAAATVDVYVNGTRALDDFAFRTATPFISLPSGVVLEIGVAPGNSTSVNDTLKNFSVMLASGQRYVAIANGVLNPSSFASNPDGKSIAFTLFLKDNIRNASSSSTDVDFIGVHGASDAPTVDIIARNVANLVDNAAYGDITGYLTVPASSYILDVTPGGDNTTIVASFTADLSTLGGGAAVVFASGFLDPMMNQNGAAFGLWAALPNGTVVEFPTTSTARLQVIHNAADPGAASVDVYVNGARLLDDFAFRTATPYIDVPAGVELNIGVAAGTSTSVNDTLKNFQVTLMNGQTYVAIANGVLNPSNFAVNPDGRSTAFTLFLQNNMREAATTTDVDFRAVHGSSDAPTVDVLARNVATLVDNAAYGDITGYLTVPASSYILDVTPGGDNTTIVASFTADLSTLGGGAAVVFASGFLDPMMNQNGAAFGLWAALPNGTVVEFPTTSTARLQVIHNAADPGAASVDVYVNGARLLDDFAFRTATPYIDVPAGVELNIGVAPGTSTSVADTLKNFQVSLTNGQTYVAIANGVLNPSSFAVNPDGRSTAFTLFLQDNMREEATSTDVDFRAVHGSSDAPNVDVVAVGAGVIVDNASYGDITPYITVPAAAYTLQVTPGNDNNTVVASFIADLSSLGGGAAVVFASGFLAPGANQNGPAFGLFAALPNGTVVAFTNNTGIEEKNISINGSLFPNPASQSITIPVKVLSSENATLEVMDATGRIVMEKNIAFSGNQEIKIDVSTLENGVYAISINSKNGRSSNSFIVNR